jgi:hypothetical protein
VARISFIERENMKNGSKKRTGLTKRIRFEVFKRDKFTCHYCGRKAPDVVLHVDHIDPVANGGGNDIINLLTSCFDCNMGKSDKKLSDNSVIEKQHKQLELLQERREQIELMFEWKKSLSRLDEETVEMIKDHIDSKISPFTIDDNGCSIIRNHLQKYSIDELLDAIDVSAKAYLKFSKENELLKESIDTFLNKIGGILFNRRLKPIDQKMAQIKNKAKNSFEYYDPKRGAILLSQYVSALKQFWNYSDEEIIKDLDEELLPKLEEKANWTEWRELLEGWIESVKKKKNDVLSLPKMRTKEELEGMFTGRQVELYQMIAVATYLLRPFPAFKEDDFQKDIYKSLLIFLEKQKDLSKEDLDKLEKNEEALNEFVINAIGGSIAGYFSYDWMQVGPEQYELLDGLEPIVLELIHKTFREEFFFSTKSFLDENHATLIELSIEHAKERISDIEKFPCK